MMQLLLQTKVHSLLLSHPPKKQKSYNRSTIFPTICGTLGTKLKLLSITNYDLRGGFEKCADMLRKMVGLRVLCLKDNKEFKTTFSEVIASLPCNLRALNLESCAMDNFDFTLKSMAPPQMFSNLRELNLSKNLVGNDGFKVILLTLNSSTIEVLNLRSAEIKEIDYQLAMNKLGPNLRILDISDNTIGNEGFLSLCRSKFEKLEVLKLQKCSLMSPLSQGEASLLRLSEIGLKDLDVSANADLKNEDLTFILDELYLTLEALDISETSVSRIPLEKIEKCKLLKHFDSLVQFSEDTYEFPEDYAALNSIIRKGRITYFSYPRKTIADDFESFFVPFLGKLRTPRYRILMFLASVSFKSSSSLGILPK